MSDKCEVLTQLNECVFNGDCMNCRANGERTVTCKSLVTDTIELAKEQQAEIERLNALLKEQHKKGQWIISNQKNIYGATKITCSNCNDSVMVQYIKDELFCRHCGADMRTVVDR